ncbi:MAG TPA: alanine--tRNA ligase [Chitinophagaceae bacterium]|nr:alanine--tRNA ligase [Chitinophagaceae bacterium]
MMTSSQIRQQFFDFFISKGHVIVPSAPIVVKNDPTLMFTNAGMNQFKDYFLGNKQPAHKRVADTQKCLRVSGKHNDLEEVGVDTYHHTMFEMLGNWSFGDYFKKEAIEWSWQLLTEVYKIPKDRLYVTVFGGDESEKLPKDDEAVNEWKKWMAEDRILLFGRKDNFWEMGDTGPCGPCTEIHVDCRPDEERKEIGGKKLVNTDNPQVIEIWNNVFIQFNRLKDGSLEPLPAKHVDTGMGFERLVRLLQNKTSNYDTDVFTGLMGATEKITAKKYTNTDSKQDVAFRVIADHIRAIGFTIADGQLPSNTGAGYVIRRILRRAVRYYFSYLDYKQPLLCQLMPLLAHQFENVFPELQKQIDFISKVVKEEEEAFLRTMDKGLKRIDDIVRSSAKIKVINGKDAFELYDTYGFPIDLTRLIASENGLAVDEKGFESEMQQQRSRSRAATAIDTEDWIVFNDSATNKFIGYDTLEAKTKVSKYRKVKAKGKESFQIVLETTPFYAESGGQVGDTGKLIIGKEELLITDTKKENELIIHFTDSIPSDLSGEVIAIVDAKKRRNTAWHHTATHLLHAALRQVLGTHVTQKGSLVNPEHLRFDFSHFAKMTDEEIAEVEELVNEKIRDNIPVVVKYMPKDEALNLGAMALFGEKYGDTVRVVIIDPTYSIELCGGTHVGATGDIGFFKITNETAVAAGVRRIEAVSGRLAEDYVNEKAKIIEVLQAQLKHPKDLSKAIEQLLEDRNELQKTTEKLYRLQAQASVVRLVSKKQVINHFDFYNDIIADGDINLLKMISSELRIKDHERSVALLIGKKDGKVNVLVALSDDLAKAGPYDANKIIKEKIAPMINGGGGGQKFLATASGTDAANIDKIVSQFKEILK